MLEWLHVYIWLVKIHQAIHKYAILYVKYVSKRLKHQICSQVSKIFSIKKLRC